MSQITDVDVPSATTFDEEFTVKVTYILGAATQIHVEVADPAGIEVSPTSFPADPHDDHVFERLVLSGGTDEADVRLRFRLGASSQSARTTASPTSDAELDDVDEGVS